MATLDDTISDFPVHSSSATENDKGEESYEDDCADEYDSEFDEDDRTSPPSRVDSSPPPATTATAAISDAAEAQVDKRPTLETQQLQTGAEISTVPLSANDSSKPRMFLSRLPVRVGATKQLSSSTTAPSSAPVSRLSNKPATTTTADTPSIQPDSPSVSARILGPAMSSAPVTSATSTKPKAVSSSAPSSKPPSRNTAKSASPTSATSSAHSHSSSPSAAPFSITSNSSTRPALYVKPNRATSSSSSSPARKSSKAAFDFSTAKSTPPSAAASTRTIEASASLLSFDSKRPLSPRLSQLHRESRWDPTPFIPPVVPQFTTQTRAHQPLLDVKQSAWQLQKARRLPTAPNVLLRKPRSEVVTRMSDVVMRTRQLRRRTKDRVVNGHGDKMEKRLEEKVERHGDEVDDLYDGGDAAWSEVSPLRLAVGEQVELQNERRTRHNSPLAKSCPTGGH